MDSPITVFSSEPSKSEEVITLSDTTSSTFMRVPASWESEQRKFKRTNSNRSLSHKQKVSNWIKSINSGEKATINVDDNKDSSPTVGYKYVSEGQGFNNHFNCDISESVITNEVYDCSSLCSYLEKCENKDSDFNVSNNKLHKDITRKTKSSYRKSLSALPKVDIIKKYHSVKVEVSDSTSVPTPTDISLGIPLSPESQKKELCSYLQLMNPADKKQVLILQNRRSTRVKNLSLMLEKKVQETKKSSEFKEKKGRFENEPWKKSTNITNKCLPRECLHFPSPPKKFRQNVDDFDHVMRTKIRLYSIDKEKGEKQVHKLNGDVKLSTNSPNVTQRNKENIKSFKKKTHLVDSTQYPKLSKVKSKSYVPKKHLKREINRERISSLRNRNLTVSSNTINEETGFNKKNSNKEPIIKKEPLVIRPKSAPLLSDYLIVNPTDTSRESNFISDISDLNFLSEEHKKCILETRLLSNSGSERSSLAQLSPLRGFKTDEAEIRIETDIEEEDEQESLADVQHAGKHIFEKVSEKTLGMVSVIESPHVEEQPTEESLPEKHKTEISSNRTDISPPKNSLELLTQIENQFSASQFPVDYSIFDSSFTEINVDGDKTYMSAVDNPKCVPFNDDKIETKSLHRSLNSTKRKAKNSIEDDTSTSHTWVPYSPSQNQKKNQHYITVSKENGSVLRAFYIDYNLIICQECLVSFWTQTALGNVLGAQNMWIQKGQAQRLLLNTKCLQKDSSEMIVATETTVAYIELWMKEHKSEVRELPVADVFATVYFWKQRQNGLERKVLQLENINGFSDDVQYLVLRWGPKIVVSWHSATNNELETKKTYIHCYELAADYQTVANISEIQAVEHYVSSLHVIEDCEELIMGCGENKITLWNVVYGYTVATIELTEIRSPLSTLWVKCDRGFLFTLQQCVDRELRLIAINGINHKWKKLASYFPPEGYNRLKGVCIENGIVLSFYDQGILCWNAQTSEPVVEETQNESDYIVSGNYVIIMGNDQINVKHAITYMISPEDTY